MKYTRTFNLLVCMLLGFTAPSLCDQELEQEEVQQEVEFEVVDQIIAIIYGQERTRIICRSEMERMSIDGRPRTLEDIIFEELMYQETIKYKIPIDESAIDKYLLTLRRQNNLSMDAVREIFRRSGYTYQEGREQLGMMYASSTMMELKIMQRLSVTDQEVQDYYDAHPEYKEAKYKLERAFVPLDKSMSQDEQKKSIEQAIQSGKLSRFQWGTPFWLKESELSEFMEFVVSMECGDISEPFEDSDGFELYRLVAVRPRYLIPLETRFREISDMLKMPKYQEEVEKYRTELIENAHIVYLLDEQQEEN